MAQHLHLRHRTPSILPAANHERLPELCGEARRGNPSIHSKFQPHNRRVCNASADSVPTKPMLRMPAAGCRERATNPQSPRMLKEEHQVRSRNPNTSGAGFGCGTSSADNRTSNTPETKQFCDRIDVLWGQPSRWPLVFGGLPNLRPVWCPGYPGGLSRMRSRYKDSFRWYHCLSHRR